MPARERKPSDSKTGSIRRRRQPDEADLVRRKARDNLAGASPQTVLDLQRQYGNRAVQGLIQPKLAVGPANDPGEQEADRVADEVAAAKRGGAPSGPRGGAGQLRLQATRTAAAGTLQLKRGLVTSNTSSRAFTGPRTDNRDRDVKAVEKSRTGAKFRKFDPIEVHDGQQAHISDSQGNIVWYRIKSGPGANQFIKAAKVLGAGGPAPGPQGPETSPEGVTLGDVADASIFTGTMVGKVDDALFEMVRAEAISTGTVGTGLNVSEGFAWGGASLLGMASALKDLADDEKSAWDKVSALFALNAGLIGGAGGTAQIVSAFSESGSTQATQASTSSTFLLGYQDMFSGLANAVKAIKGVVELIKMAVSDKKFNKREYIGTGTELVTSGLETAKSTLRAVRHISEALSGSTSTQFMQVIPGLDIAIMAVKSITQGYYLAVSAVEWSRMQERKLELEAQLIRQGFTQEQITAAGKQHRTEEAMGAKLAELTAQTQLKIDKATGKLEGLSLEGTDRQVARATAQRDLLTEKIAALREKKAGYAASQAEHTEKMRAGEGQVGGPTRLQLEERELASDLSVANKRRVTRQAIHIGTNLVQVAGSIAALVSGPGAPAAVALKLSAAGVDASLPLFRWIKQKGRDVAAKNLAKGEPGRMNKIFNADKSTAAKLAARKKQAVVILTMVGKLHRYFPRATEGDAFDEQVAVLKEQAKRVEGYIRASGCPPEKLYAANGKPDEQVRILVAELSRRELI